MELPVYISFIVSIYNVSDFLDDCLQSLCRIQNPQVEILLINDGSTDNCPAICQKYAELDSRIRVITQDNQGVSASRNNGLRQAQGEWVCFVDGDDYISIDFDSRIIQKLDDTVEINYFGCQLMVDGREPSRIDRKEYFLREEDLWKVRMHILNTDIYQESHKFPSTFFGGAPFAKFINRKKLLEWQITFDESLSWGEDLLFNFRLLQYVKRAKVVDCTGYYYRINLASMTQRYDVQSSNRFLSLINSMGQEVEKTNCAEAKTQYQVFVVKQLLQSVQRNILNPQNPQTYRECREAYRRLRYSEEVQKALKKFPYKYVRFLYKIAIGITATGSYRLLWLFYQMKRLSSQGVRS